MLVGVVARVGAGDDVPEYSVPHPHPMLTEVLFNVPRGESEGDANGDGVRDAAGDEFIEIGNPYDHAINLGGYVLSSRLSSPVMDTGKGVRFVFPDVELGAHQIAVVFNGYGWDADGSIGTSTNAPDGPRGEFGGALVFTMGNRSKMRALRNSGDFVLLSAPDGTPLDCVTWGDSQPQPPSEAYRLSTVAAGVSGSVQRVVAQGKMLPHKEIDGRLFSPGDVPQR